MTKIIPFPFAGEPGQVEKAAAPEIRDRFHEDDIELEDLGDLDDIEAAIAKAEALVIRAQAKAVVMALCSEIDQVVEAGDLGRARVLIQRVRLVLGDRRIKFVDPETPEQ